MKGVWERGLGLAGSGRARGGGEQGAEGNQA